MSVKRGKWVFYWHSASEILQVRFVRWRIMKMHTGGEDTNRLGVGAVVRSDWCFEKCICPKIDKGLKRGQALLRPYWELYRSYNSARKNFRPIKRPTVETVKKLEKRRIKK